MKNNEKTIILGKYKNKDQVMTKFKIPKDTKLKIEKLFIKYAKVFCKKHFDILFDIPIIIDGRLTSVGGSFRYKINGKSKHIPSKIKMSERYIKCAFMDKDDGIEAIYNVLNHELVHYALCYLGKDHSDGTYEFESTLARLNIGSSGATSKSKRMSETPNVWYTACDVYVSLSGKQHNYKHTQKEQDWLGKRIGYRIIKSDF